jgi:4-amino-4-deoxy-L-arabinose transferase-like glycosyltransferase
VSAIFGTATLPVFWLLARKLKGKWAGLTALFLLALCPWHIMISRWALESNLLPFFLILGIYFTAASMERPKLLIAAGAAFGLALYAYGTAFVFLPLFLLMAAAYLLKRRLLHLREFLIALAVFVVIALPIGLCNVINVLNLPGISIGPVTLPRLTETRQTATMGFSLKNFTDFLKILVKQTDGYCYNAVEGFMFFPGYLVFTAAGVAFAAYDGVKRRSTGEALMLMALAASFIAAFFINVNINRINMAFLPVAYFTAMGIYRLLALMLHAIRPVGAVCCALALALLIGSTAYAGHIYLTDTQDTLSWWFFDGLGEAIQYAETLNSQEFCVTDSVNAPYIFVLFYNEIPPEEFTSSVEYLNPDGAFRSVLSFSKYTFGAEATHEDAVFVLRIDECDDRDILAIFGNYAVCR